MLDFSSGLNLTFIWSLIVGLAVFLYVLLDGFDLGVGILFPFAPNDESRDHMMNSIAPFWDGNETWLVLGGVGLFAAFPLAYAILMPALYVPLILMLAGLILRGVAFEFRFKASNAWRGVWDASFHFGSLIATLMQGMILGSIVRGIHVSGRAFSGGPFDWLTGFPLMTGVALVFGYILLGATWLIMKSEGGLQEWARKTARYALLHVGFFMTLVTLWTPFLHAQIIDRWFSWPNTLYLSIFPLGTVATFVYLVFSVSHRHEVRPFFLVMTLFMLNYLGLLISLWPWVVPYAISWQQAAAANTTLSLLLIGAVLFLPIVLIYTGYSYYVFKGKATTERHY